MADDNDGRVGVSAIAAVVVDGRRGTGGVLSREDDGAATAAGALRRRRQQLRGRGGSAGVGRGRGRRLGHRLLINPLGGYLWFRFVRLVGPSFFRLFVR